MKNNYEILVHYQDYENMDYFTFEVTFHDGYIKKFKATNNDYIAARCSLRDYMENVILDHYEEYYNIRPILSIVYW